MSNHGPGGSLRRGSRGGTVPRTSVEPLLSRGRRIIDKTHNGTPSKQDPPPPPLPDPEPEPVVLPTAEPDHTESEPPAEEDDDEEKAIGVSHDGRYCHHTF